jgi:hypothetical protein
LTLAQLEQRIEKLEKTVEDLALVISQRFPLSDSPPDVKSNLIHDIHCLKYEVRLLKCGSEPPLSQSGEHASADVSRDLQDLRDQLEGLKATQADAGDATEQLRAEIADLNRTVQSGRTADERGGGGVDEGPLSASQRRSNPSSRPCSPSSRFTSICLARQLLSSSFSGT